MFMAEPGGAVGRPVHAGQKLCPLGDQEGQVEIPGRESTVGEGIGTLQCRPNERTSWEATSRGPGGKRVGQARPVGPGRQGVIKTPSDFPSQSLVT